MAARPKISIEVVDPISIEEANAPPEREKWLRLQLELAETLQALSPCKQHGRLVSAKAWHVAVEMRAPIAVRDRFYVTIDVDARRHRDIGPMSADIADRMLYFVESGIEAGHAGKAFGTVSREIIDITEKRSQTP